MKKKLKSLTKKKMKIDLLGRVLELPPGILSSDAHIELFSNREAVVDGCRGVMEYDDTFVKLNTGTGMVCFKGRGLVIASFEHLQAVIKGHILSIEFGLI